MSDDPRPVAPDESLPPLQPPAISAADPAVQQQINAVVQQMTAQFEQQRALVLEQAQAQFQRQLAEMQAQQGVRAWAQNASTPTIHRQHAIPGTADELYALAMEMPNGTRPKFMAFVDRINESGLVSFEEIGSAGDAGDEPTAKEQFDAAIQAKVGTGMSKLAAIQAVGKEQPDLYAAYQAESLTPKVAPAARPAKKGGR